MATTVTPAQRGELIAQYKLAVDERGEWVRRQVINNDRIDILAEVVLGMKLQPFHKKMLQFLFKHKHSLHLAFRGSGKTTTLTVLYIMFRIIKDRNIRVLISSKTIGFAQDILREIKAHFETNEQLREIFGDFVSDEKWDEGEIIVKGRTRTAKESTITTVGIGGQVVGKHYDLAFGDDLVDEDNARTEYMRTQTRTWFYKSLHPTLEPHSELHIIGTRYHFNDLYGHLIEHEMKLTHLIVPALDLAGRSPWEEKYPAVWFAAKRAQMGTVIFNSQYQCDTEAMKGEIFSLDFFDKVPASAVPPDALGYCGADLAIAESEAADLFAIAGVRMSRDGHIYICALRFGHFAFSKQTDIIIDWWDTGMDGACPPEKMAKIGIETNAYQKAQYDNVKDRAPNVILKAIITDKDKVTRAWRLASRFEEGKIHVVDTVYDVIVDHLVPFPGGRYKDVFDAVDLAVTTAVSKRRTNARAEEPGLI